MNFPMTKGDFAEVKARRKTGYFDDSFSGIQPGDRVTFAEATPKHNDSASITLPGDLEIDPDGETQSVTITEVKPSQHGNWIKWDASSVSQP
jgi:hypothetical protein